MASDNSKDGLPKGKGRVAKDKMHTSKNMGTGKIAHTGKIADSDTARCRSVLDQLLRETVISRLRLSHADDPPRQLRGTPAPPECSPAPPVTGDQAIFNLAALLLDGQMDASEACAEAMVREGGGLDAFFLDVAPRVAAALYGSSPDSADVDLKGMQPRDSEWRMQQLIDRLNPRFPASRPAAPHGGRALLATHKPGRHRLHLRITAECFARDGWDACCDPRELDDLVEMVRTEWFSIIMIASDEAGQDQLAKMIRVLRRASCNPHLRVLVMDEALARRPNRLARLGADAAATDIRHVCAQAQRLLSIMPPPV